MLKIFTTPTCAVCKTIKSFIDVPYDEIILNDDTREIFAEYNVKGAPTLFFIKDDKVIHRHEGFISKKDFEETYQRIFE